MIEQPGAANETPVREPVFTQLMQIGIVVRDLDAAIQHCVDEYGIGPWERHELNPENATDVRIYGQPAAT
jgi:hypothetical protein